MKGNDLNLSMLSNSKSKDGSLKNMQNIYWANRVYNNIKKLVFSEIKLYVLTIIMPYKCSVICG